LTRANLIGIMNQQVIARVSDDADTRVSCRVRKREDSEAGSRV